MSDLTAPQQAAETLGLRAKASFLLRELMADDIAGADRAAALWAFVADADRLVGALGRADREQAAMLVAKAIGEGDAWHAQCLPDAKVSGADRIDGVNLPAVVLAPDGVMVKLGEFDAPPGMPLVVSAEFSVPPGTTVEVELVSVKGSSVQLRAEAPTGYQQFVSWSLESAPKGGLRLQASASGDQDASWFQSTAVTDAAAVAGLAAEMRSVVSKPPPSSAFTPITTEPLTISDIDRLYSLHNRFAGERVFIMGNGPSLNQTPLDKLESEFVFGLNRISLLFERVSWRPTFFTAFDVRVVPDNKEEFAALDVPYKFFSARYKTMLGEQDNHFWHHTKGFYEGFESAFAPTVPFSGFGGGGTIGVIAIELAFFLGFREIYLIGTDVSYTVPESVKQTGDDVFGDGVKLQLESTEDDPNHFDPSYFGKGKKWHNPNVREMKIGFGRAAAYVERAGGRLLNATVGGELEQVPRVDFDSLF